MATVSPSLSSKSDARGLSEILLRFSGDRSHVYRVKSGIFVAPARWDPRSGRIIIPRIKTPEQLMLQKNQADLDGLVARLLDYWAKADPSTVTRISVQRQVYIYHNPALVAGPGESVSDLMARYEEASDVSERRKKKYRSVAAQLRRFEGWRGVPLFPADMTAEDLRDSERVLLDEHRFVDQKRWASLYADEDVAQLRHPRGKNTIVTIMAVLRGCLHWAQRERIIEKTPFDTFRVGAAVYGTPYYITIEERDRIAGCNLNRHEALRIQRDIFVFQCLVGCRVGDLVNLKKDDVAGGILQYVPHKTKGGSPHVVRVPLVKGALEIIDRYKSLEGDRLLPCISPQKYNDALKRIFLAAGITRKVSVINPVTREEEKIPLNLLASSHLARRTFVGNLYRQVKDPAIVGAMSGHVEGSRAFARYRAIDDEMKREVVGLLEHGADT